MNAKSGYIWKLGLFVSIGLVVFMIAIYFIGKNRNLFVSTFTLKSHFSNVGGLQIGNNVRFSGINVGTVEDIDFISDTVVVVGFRVKKEVQRYIKKDAKASIGSDGLMGDKVLTISPGTVSQSPVKDEDIIPSTSTVEMEEIMKSVKTSVDNAGIITQQLAEFTTKINNGEGALSRLMNDKAVGNSLENTLLNLEKSTNEFASFTEKMNDNNGVLSRLVTDEKLGKSIDSTVMNIQQATKGLNENMEAAKHNVLLRGYFNKKKKAEARKQRKQNRK